MSLPVIHIVRRFGRVGGMESYVWHLVHGLVDQDIQVTVICEQVCESPEESIRIVKVETSSVRPRWKSMMTFRALVDQKIRDMFRGQTLLIHSHERSVCHQVTTFHGPPIEPPRRFGWLSRFNKRFTAWQQMELKELLGPNVQMILPVSSQVQQQLTNRYPEIEGKKMLLAWPGVTQAARSSSLFIRKRSTSVNFLFVGKEWKRKGFDIAVDVVDEFRRSYGTASLTAFGVDRTDLPRSTRALEWISFQGWSSSIPWSDFDVLLHPARKEPFGMVVAEARSHGIPVAMSSQVGVADLKFSGTKILDVSAPVEDWCEATAELIQDNLREPEVKWSWDDLVVQHVEMIYPQLKGITL